MRRLRSLLILASCCLGALHSTSTLDANNYYVLHHDPTFATLAEIAELLSLHIVEPIGELENHWLARAELPNDGRDETTDPVLARHERLRAPASLFSREIDVSSAVRHLSREVSHKVSLRAPPSLKRGPAEDAINRLAISDPLFPEQWHLTGGPSQNTLNVIPVWDQMKLTGKNITVAVVDNGVFHEHQDLKDNFDMKNSYDYVGKKDTPESPDTEDNHGTMCAGAIAGAKNDVCGVGVAFNAKIAGLRIMDAVQSVKHSDEAKAMNHGFQDVSIYSYSFGPEDDGETLGPEVYVLEQALLKGVNEGRGGKGSVFVFSAGNGGLPVIGDNCGYDGYINSIHSIAVGALDHTGNHAPFSELCASVMVVTSGGWDDRNIATIDTTDDKACNTEDFVGTSSSSALAAGVFALALEARPDLTWRDMQHLCVNTARVIHEGADWERTESGRPYSYKYGFGALDAYEFVKAAKTWELVKPQTWIKTKPVQLRQGLLPGMGKGTMDATGAFSGGKPLSGTAFSESVKVTKEMVDAAEFDVIEHVQVKVWIQHSRRGDIEVEIESPRSKKVVSLLGMKRPNDKADTGLRGWTFTSLKHWGEQPLGDWVLRFKDQGNENKGNVIGFSVTFWGSARKDSKDPVLYKLPADDKNVFPPVSK